MQDLISIYTKIPTALEGDKTKNRIINFSKFYNMFSVAAELETFRNASYEPGEILGDRESNLQLIQHIRKISGSVESSDLGLNIKFAEGVIPEGNKNLSTALAAKSIKKIVTMVGVIKEEK